MKLELVFAATAALGFTLAGSGAIRLHSRHIPDEHLRHNDFSRSVKTETLSTCLDPDKIGDFARWGVDTIELRLCWWALEKTPGVFDWSRFDRDLGRVEAAGLKGGLMCWYFFPPDWCKDGVRFRCTRHGEDANILSPWDPDTLRVADRIYAAAAARYGRRIDYVYTMSCGDYGESQFLAGVKHYKFSSPHTHPGVCWTGDRLARAAWAKISPVSVEDVLAGKADRATRLRYMNFCEESIADYTAKSYEIARRRFPWARFGHPVGGGEAWLGNCRSLTVKRLCEVSTNITVRWTSLASERDFGRANVLARRVSSACRFYGCPFGEEISFPTILVDTNVCNHAMYELLANNATMLHNDYLPMKLGGDARVRQMAELPNSDPVTDVALLWPDIGEELDTMEREEDPKRREQSCWIYIYNTVLGKGRKMRMHTDYEVCDTRMIRDGYLEKTGIRKLVAFNGVPPETEAVLGAFRARGGVVTDGEEYMTVPDRIVYRTTHRDFVSEFDPVAGTISFSERKSERQQRPGGSSSSASRRVRKGVSL